MQGSNVVLEGVAQRPDPADPLRRLDATVELRLDPVLIVIGKLESVGGEQLDAIVGIRVMRRGDDRCQCQPVPLEQQRRGGRRQHPRQQGVAAGCGDPGGHRGLEHLPGLAGVTDDQHLRVRALGRGVLVGSEGHGGAGERQRQVRGQELPGTAADAIRAE